MDAAVLGVIRSQFTRLKMPNARDKVYKDECMFSFDSPFSETGLYVNLVTWYGYSESHFLQDALKTNSVLYLHEKWDQIPIQSSETIPEAPMELAIGTATGFMTEAKFDIIKSHSLIVIDSLTNGQIRIPVPCTEIPEFVSNIIQAVIDHDGMKSKMQLDTWSADQEIFESKYAATLPVLDNGKKISQDPKSWACEASGQTENLWLNLSTGFIGGGRKNWDGTGGSGAAMQHYLDTGKKYPLCVKLGTITAHGGDVWSYAEEEDTLVKDTLLALHLSRWGINIMSLEKTDKTMGEMEVDLNMKYDWSKILESGESLQGVAGPGKVGLRNIGSSCYLNSVMQVLVSIPELSARYLTNRSGLLASAPSDASSDFAVQMSKLCHALLSDVYVDPATKTEMMQVQDSENRPDSSTLERFVVAPRMFKQLVGKDHLEFSSGRQQDAAEYFQHVLQVMTRSERSSLARMPQSTGMLDSAVPSSALFDYYVQNRDECSVTQHIKLGASALESILQLHIPLDRATNRGLIDASSCMEMKRQKTDEISESGTGLSEADAKLEVPFHACLDCAFGPEVIEAYSNPALGGHTAPATRIMRMKTFPPYLMIKMNRYIMGGNWLSVKKDASVAVPESLDLEQYRARGLQAGEVEMPSSNDTIAPPAPTATVTGSTPVVADEGIVAQLTSMGFSIHGSQRAAIATNNVDADTAMAWVFAHMEDPNFNEPITTDKAGSVAVQAFSSQAVDDLCSMGFTLEQVQVALGATAGDPTRAADWLFSRDNLDAAVAKALAGMAAEGAGPGVSSETSSGSAADKALDGPGKYSLLAIISHIGKSTSHGHYVAHIKKNDQWMLFNDEKVALSKQPPLDAGFMYLFKRN